MGRPRQSALDMPSPSISVLAIVSPWRKTRCEDRHVARKQEQKPFCRRALRTNMPAVLLRVAKHAYAPEQDTCARWNYSSVHSNRALPACQFFRNSSGADPDQTRHPLSLRPPLRVVVTGGTWAQGLAGFFFARRVVESGIGRASHTGWLPGAQIAPTLEVPTLQRVSNRSFTQLAPMVSRPDKGGILGP